MRRICPLISQASGLTGRIIRETALNPCIKDKCMWWVKEECAVTIIAKALMEKKEK